MVVNAISLVSFTPIGSQVLEFYDVNVYILNTIFIMQLLFYVIFTIPSNVVIDKHGCHWSNLYGSALTLFGVILKCLVNIGSYGFSFCIIG